MRSIKITESQLREMIKNTIGGESEVSSEGSEAKELNGRELIINSDGTISIKNSKGQMIKIRLSTKLGEINVVGVTKIQNGYQVSFKSGATKVISTDDINKIVSFADAVDKEGEISKFPISLKLKKV